MDTLHATHIPHSAARWRGRVWRSVAAAVVLTASVSTPCHAGDPPKPGAVQWSDALKAKGGAAFAVKVLPAGDQYLWVQDKVAIVGGTIRKAFHHLDPGARYYSLNITLQKEAGKIMEEVSSANIGKPIAIILDGEVLSAPTVNMTFGAHFMITGSFTEQQAHELASQLEHPLKNPLKVENPTFVPAPAAPSKP